MSKPALENDKLFAKKSNYSLMLCESYRC